MVSRREMMLGAAVLTVGGRAGAAVVATGVAAAGAAVAAVRGTAAAVRLCDGGRGQPALSAAAQPDRLLHNFRKYAGLRAESGDLWRLGERHDRRPYAGPLPDRAGAQTWQQTGDAEMRRRADYIVDGTGGGAGEARHRLCRRARAQAQRTARSSTARRSSRRSCSGEIKSGGFDLNGSWSPLYTVHKLFAGLLDVHAGWGNAQALTVAGRPRRLFRARVRRARRRADAGVLGCEYGGLNESYAELYARTGDARWLADGAADSTTARCSIRSRAARTSSPISTPIRRCPS